MSRRKSRQQDRRRLRRILNRNVDCVLQIGVSFTGKMMRERASHLDATGSSERRRLLRGHYDPVEFYDDQQAELEYALYLDWEAEREAQEREEREYQDAYHDDPDPFYDPYDYDYQY